MNLMELESASYQEAQMKSGLEHLHELQLNEALNLLRRKRRTGMHGNRTHLARCSRTTQDLKS